ncbi:MAG: hypothetical protein ACLUB2_04605, partial [Butyricicoccus pullicaecorum]
MCKMFACIRFDVLGQVKKPFPRGTVLMSAFDARGISLAAASDGFYFWLIPGADTGNQRGIPDSAESGQPARLDRAGS